jgi:hypothetical protein
MFVTSSVRFERKAFKRFFQFWVIFHNYNNYSGKTERANDLIFCTKVISIDLHRIE